MSKKRKAPYNYQVPDTDVVKGRVMSYDNSQCMTCKKAHVVTIVISLFDHDIVLCKPCIKGIKEYTVGLYEPKGSL